MKSIKLLLSALVVSAMFASCAKEEMTVAPENQIAGAELLGTNISVNFGKGVDTKILATGVFEDTDKLGLGWLRANESTPVDALGANHMFELGTNGLFSTKGNVYEGWHFGYYPFQYMPAPDCKLEYVLNPEQTEKGGKVELYESGLFLTAREFLTKKANLDNNNQLVGVTYDLFPVFKTILVNVTPDKKFTDNPVLADLNITSVTIDAGANKGVFPTGTIKIYPSKLAEIQYDYDKVADEYVYNKAKTYKAFYENLKVGVINADQGINDPQVFTHDGWHSQITSSSKSDEIDLSGTQTLRIHTLPTEITLSPADVKFIINANNGTFTVTYTDPAKLAAGETLTEAQKANNEAIKDFVQAYAKDGALSAFNFNDKGEYREIKNFYLTLTPDLFDYNFKNIDSEEAWNHAVKVVDALGLSKKDLAKAGKEFTIVNGKDGKPWYFEDVDKNGKLINLPASEIVVTGTMYLGADGEWPASGIDASKASVEVKEGVNLAVAKGVTLKASVCNRGTISVKENAKVETVDNTEGRINVVYGSYVILSNESAHGTVAYVVTGNDKASEINELTADKNKVDNTKLVARVNTLVVGEGLSFDLSMVDANSGTAYNPIVGKGLERMAEMNFELNGGTVKADQFSYEKVANVEVIGGSSKVYNVNVTGNLKVSAGKVTIDAKEQNGYKESVKIGSIDNKAQIIANTDVYTAKISNPAGAKTTVKGEKTIWYTNTYAQGGTASGKILKLSASEGSAFNDIIKIDASAVSTTDTKANGTLARKAIANAKGGTIFLPKGTYDFGTASSGWTQVGQGSTMSENQRTNGFTIIGEAGTVIVANDRGLRFIGDDANETVITYNLVNLTVKSENSQAIYAKAYANVNLVNVTIDSPNTTGAKSIIFDTFSDGNEGATATINAHNVTIPAKSSIEFLGGVGHTNYFNYTGGKNITDNVFVVAAGYPSTGANYFVNGVALPKAK